MSKTVKDLTVKELLEDLVFYTKIMCNNISCIKCPEYKARCCR